MEKKLHFGRLLFYITGLFISLLFISMSMKSYVYTPTLAFLAYSGLICGLLLGLSLARTRRQFLIVSVYLILLGTIASIDMLLTKSEIIQILIREDVGISEDDINNSIQIVLILINIFTGSLAANAMFHGLCLTSRVNRQ